MTDSDVKKPISSQPQAIVPMVVGGNRNANDRPVGVDGLRDWSFGLFNYPSRCGLCLTAAVCPCVVYSRNRQRLYHLQQQGTPLPRGSETYDGHCLLYTLLIPTGYPWILHAATRAEARLRYGIRGVPVTDCLNTWFCWPCSLTQERREIELEEGSF